MIIDAQVHVWSQGLSSGEHRKVSRYTAEELLAEMAVAKVDGAILHPPSWDPASNEVASNAVQRYPGKFAILGHLAIDQPSSRDRIAHWRETPGMVGLRFALLKPSERTWHSDGTMDWVWAAAERTGLPIALLAWRFLPALKTIAERHPGLRFIVDHIGLVRPKQDAAAFETLPDLMALATLPNVAVKATGAPGYSTQPYPYMNLHDGLHRIFDAFGPNRFFWGTDLTRMPCSYRQCVTMFTEELPWLQGDDLAKVMGRGICNWLDLEPNYFIQSESA
ncbi:amidohydrolase [Acidisphaera sp. L21]|uniref:amidohydrolase family protein n=1 Tax=Acidisphaera sp. L21 TaxID=1641851 RepID=UPI00131B8927|nr:amidohydrolase family protein [Acidisphaera sp. L21]